MKNEFFREMTNTKWYPLPHALYTQGKLVIDWSTFGTKAGSTRHQKQYLVKSSKELLVAILRDMQHKTLRPSPQTIYGHFIRIRQLSNWMIEQGKWRFSELDCDDIYNFLLSKSINRITRQPLANKTLLTHFCFLQKLWRLRGEYTASLRVEPKMVQPDVMRSVQTQEDKKWKPLPDDMALRLIQNATWWIDSVGPSLLNLNVQLWSLRPKLIGLNKKNRTKILRLAYTTLHNHPELQTLRNALDDPTSSPFLIVRKAYSLIEGACITVILFFVGMRVSELSAMNAGTLIKVRHSDGEEYDYVNSIGAKMKGKPRSWVAAPPVRTAIELLTNLYAEVRHERKNQSLLLAYNGNGTIVFPDRFVTRMTISVISLTFQKFATFSFLGMERNDVRIHPHAARKTFARFVVRRDKTTLEALAHHFGHVHRLVTDHSYVGSDIELACLLEEENRTELASCLSHLLTSANIGGKAGSAILELRSNSKNFKFKGKHSLDAMVDSLISKGVQLAPCNWGYCVYSKALSACSGDDHGPNEMKRSPTVCGSCSNFVVTEKHRTWWEDRIKEDEKFLGIEQASPQAKIVVSKRLEQAIQLLRGLNTKRFEK